MTTELEKRLAEICNDLAGRKTVIVKQPNFATSELGPGRVREITAIRDEIIEAVGLAHCVDCGFVIDD